VNDASDETNDKRAQAGPAEASSRQPAPDEQAPRQVRVDRRRFLIGAGAVGGALALLAAGLRSWRNGLPLGPLSTIVSAFPVRTAEDDQPDVPLSQWTLRVDGLVARPLTVDAAAWARLPRAAETRDFHCVEGWSVDKVRWAGVRLADLLHEAGPLPATTFVTFHALGGTYSDSLTLAESLDPEVMLADTLDGAPLPHEHGGPLRLVVPSQLGYKNVKWVTRVELSGAREIGYWEHYGYAVEAPVPGRHTGSNP
jgi:DMSO/TMAO reductase YedYZ molybdopterin-dependent catalytic subunit